MAIGPDESQSAATAESVRQLREVRRALQLLHKTLLDAERVRYERLNGRIEGGPLLQLVIHDPWFSWLRPLSALMVHIDEELDADEPLPSRTVTELLQQVRQLLRPAESGNVFQENYYSALQDTPDVVIAHRGVTRLLPPPADAPT